MPESNPVTESFFVIKKFDALDVEKSETIDKLLRDVREYLAGFGTTPISAILTLLNRKKRKGNKLSRTERILLDSV